jgi:hypothetical protein
MNCPRCGAVSYGTKFCMSCRTRLVEGEAGGGGQPAAPSARPPVRAASGGERNPAQSAALASVLAPLVLIFFNMLGPEVRKEPAVNIALVGLSVLALVIGFVSSIAAFVLARQHGSERVVGRAILGLVLCAGLLGLMGVGLRHGVQNARERQRLAAQIEESKKSLDQILEQAVQGQDVGQQGTDNLARMGTLFRKQAETLQGHDRDIMISLADVTDTATRVMQARDAATRPFLEGGGISPENLVSRQAVTDRAAQAETARASFAQYEASMNALPSQLQKALESRGVPADQVAKATKTYADSLGLPLVAEFCRVEQEFLAAAVDLLQLLESSFGRWSFDKASESIEFQDAQLVDPYNALIGRIQAAAKEETEVQQRILDSRRTKQAPK